MPRKLICCVSLPPATITSIPIDDFAIENMELAKYAIEQYYACCGKYICKGCEYSSYMSGIEKCPFCNSDRADKTEEEQVEEIMKRVEANDACAMFVLGNQYIQGSGGLLQDEQKATELWKQAAKLGYSLQAHFQLGVYYHERGDSRKKKFHFEAAAMAGNEVARYNLGCSEQNSGNMEQAVKHLTIAASAGHHEAMNFLIEFFEKGHISRESIDSTLTAYNNSCAKMRSEARDAFIRITLDRIGGGNEWISLLETQNHTHTHTG
jgi:TPR repeat protein